MTTAESPTSAVHTRILDTADDAYIEDFLKLSHQKSLFKSWVTIKMSEKDLRDRILVVNNFRVLLIKVEHSSRKIETNCPLLDLNILEILDPAATNLNVAFRTDSFVVVSLHCPAIVHAILTSFIAITYGTPFDLLPRISIPREMIDSFVPPTPDVQDGLIASYLAICDYLEVEPRPRVVDYLLSAMQNEEKSLDFRACFTRNVYDHISDTEIDTLTTALRFSSLFESLVISQTNLGEQAMECISSIFLHNEYLKHLEMIQISAAGKTNLLLPLSKSLVKNRHSLRSIVLAQTHIGDAGVELLTEGLSAASTPLKMLVLEECGITAKGVKSLMELMKSEAWKTSVVEFELTGNKIGKQGSELLAEYIFADNKSDTSIALEFLDVGSCDLDCDILLQAILNNDHLTRKKLARINLSGNKLTKTACSVLGKILGASSKCSDVYIAQCSVKKPFLDIIFNGMKMNGHNVKFLLDLSMNDLGNGVSKKIADSFPQTDNTIKTLILANNSLGAEGISNVCASLQEFIALHTLVLDCNVSVGIFTNSNELGVEIANFISTRRSLKVLSLAGSSTHYFKSGLVPIFEELEKNTTLSHLNVSSNRFTDEVFNACFEMLKKNSTLSILEMDNNRWTLELLSSLQTTLQANSSISNMSVIPLEDVRAIFQANPKQLKDMEHVLMDIEDHILNNQARQTAEEMQSARTHTRKIAHTKNRSDMLDLTVLKQGRTISSALDALASEATQERKGSHTDTPSNTSLTHLSAGDAIAEH